MRLNRMILRRLRICSKPCLVRPADDHPLPTVVHLTLFPLSDTSEKVAPWPLWSPTVLYRVALACNSATAPTEIHRQALRKRSQINISHSKLWVKNMSQASVAVLSLFRVG